MTAKNLALKVSENKFGQWFGWVVYLPTDAKVNYSDALTTAEEALRWANNARAEYVREFPAAELPTDSGAGREHYLLVGGTMIEATASTSLES